MVDLPLVSIVIAAYNAGRFLRETIASALAQTYPRFEVCLVDDGSADNSAAVMDFFARQDTRVRVHKQANQGQASAKNAGIRMARGDLIAFLDADDLWLPDKLELQVPRLAPASVGVCYTDAMFIDEHGSLFSRPRPPYHSGRVTRQLFMDNFVPFPSAVVKRECLERCGTFDESLSMGIDWDLWLRISTTYEFVFVNRALIKYRVWAGQMSSKIDGRFDGAYRIMRNFQQQHSGFVDARLGRRAWSSTFLSHAQRLSTAGRHQEAFLRLSMAFMKSPLRPRLWMATVRAAGRALSSRPKEH